MGYTFKVLIIGPGAVGKTSLLERFIHNKFSQDYKFTIGVDFLIKKVEYEPDKEAKLTIWDIGAQQRFRFLARSFYEGANGALVVFDLSNAQSFTEMKEWHRDMHQLQGDIPVVIVGNKSDLIPEIGEVVDRHEPKRFATEHKSTYIKTSAKTGDHVEDAFTALTKRMVKKVTI